MNYRLTAPLLAVLLTACSTGQTPPAESTGQQTLLPQSRWQVEWLGERPLVDNSHMTLVLGEEGRAYGDGGCNRWLSNYELRGAQLHFTVPVSTMMGCAEALMEQEQRFLSMLAKVSHWDFAANGQLQLWPEDNSPPIRLWPEQD